MFHIGQKVVCVRDIWLPPKYGEALPVKNRIYTVREAFIHPIKGVPAIRLREIRNPVCQYDDMVAEKCFAPFCFRPVRETDISVFTAMLETTDISEAAE